jgi:hypothetical protein
LYKYFIFGGLFVRELLSGGVTHPFKILVYTGFWFIQDSGLYWILVYTGFWFNQD